MLEQDDTSTTSTTSTGEAPPKKAPRRRASKAAAAPDAAPDTATAPEAAPGNVPGEEAAPAPAKRAPRKRAAKKAAPAAESPETPETPEAPKADEAAAAQAPETTDTPETSETAAAPAAAGTEAPARGTRRRRASSRTAAPAEEAPAAEAAPAPAEEAPAPDAPAAGAPAEDAPAEDAPAPRKRTPRKRGTKAAAAPEPVEPEAAATEDEAVDEAPAEEPTAEAPEAPAEPAAEPAAEDGDAPRRRRRAPAVVTFVAPDEAAPAPSRSRRRGSSRPTAAEPAADTAVTSEPAPAQAPEQPAEQPAEEAATPGRRRRRASSRGAVTPEELLAPAAAPEVGADADVDDETEPETDAPAAEADEDDDRPRRRRRGRRGRGRRPEGSDDEGTEADEDEDAPAVAGDAPAESSAEDTETSEDDEDEDDDTPSGTRRRRRRRRRGGSGGGDAAEDDVPTVVHVREPREKRVRGASAADEDGVRGITGSTRIAAKRVRRQEGRDSGRRRAPVLTEAEFLARRESVERHMVVRQKGDLTQIAVLEDGVLVEHHVTKATATSYAGNVYLGTVQNVLPSMEAAFVDIGKGRNGVLYAGEVNFEGAGSRKIEAVLKSGQDVLVQVSKDPIGHKGARLTSQISLPGRYLVYVPEGSMTGISRKLPDTERSRLKAILKKVVPDDAGVIIRTAAEGASEEEIAADVARLQAQWEEIKRRAASTTKSDGGGAPKLLHGEPDLVVRVVRDVFNEDFATMTVSGDQAWTTISEYVTSVAPDLKDRVKRHTSDVDVFAVHRIDEQLLKAMDRKVHLPSGGSLVIDRTEAMVVVDVNTGKFVGKGGNLEETVTRNNLEAAEEIARQLRLRDLGGIIVVDFIDMVLESNRDLVVRRLVECMGRDRTKHQVAEVTSLGLVQMTRKRVGQGLIEAFSETCESCGGRGVHVRHDGTGAPLGGGRSADGGAGIERVAKALKPKDEPSADAPADEAADEDVPRPRRRRGGRGRGAATVAPQDEMSELLAEPAGSEIPPPPLEGDEPEVDAVADAPAVVAADPAAASSPSGAPAELVGESSLEGASSLPAGEAAEQPTAAEEDAPVVPDVLASVTDPEPEPDPEPAAPVRRRRRASSRPAAAPDA